MDFVPQSKKGNKKAKRTSEQPPHCRSEGRSKEKRSSINVKRSKVSVTCSKIFQWLYCQVLKQLSWHWPESEVTTSRVKRPSAPDALRFITHSASLMCMVWFYGPAQIT